MKLCFLKYDLVNVTKQATHYKGKSGKLYPKKDYSNIEIDRVGVKALPKDDYPYTIKYDDVWRCNKCDNRCLGSNDKINGI